MFVARIEHFQNQAGLNDPAVVENGSWRAAIAIHRSVTPRVVPHVLAFGLLATVIEVAALGSKEDSAMIGLPVALHEIAGGPSPASAG